MSSWADNDGGLERARELLADRFPHTVPAIIDTFDLAYIGWEADYMGALITRDGVPEIVVIDRFSSDTRPDIEQVREQLAEYRRLIEDTERVLARYRELCGLESGGRVAVDVCDLSPDELERLADSNIPEDLRWNSDGMPPPDLSQLKQQLARAVIYATEAAGEWDQAAFIQSIGFPQDWMIHAFDKPDRVPLAEFVQVYDAAAKRACWQPLHEIVKEVTARQRFKEWP